MRTALITGATGGLGSELARGLDSRGYRVIVHYFKNSIKAEALLRELKNSPIPFQADLSRAEDVKKALPFIKGSIDSLDLIINNASITKDSLMLRLSEEDWDRVISVNLTGAFNIVKTFTPLMVSSGGGHIINITSLSGLRGRPGQAAYSASKAALVGFSLSLARELSVYNIKVNSLIPGYLPTGMGLRAERAMEKAREESLLKRLSNPSAVVEFVDFLVRQDITGQTFSIETRI
ncbi:MAG: SDR family NAD(P)-dependent oxidoreductase [Nitrospirae bacterium]|nr:MAG: SDR family NAD(P)-dependent oxidoreductase [Nitrospirota bacterium]